MSERLFPFQCLFDLIFIICEAVFDRSWDSNKADFFTSNKRWTLRTWTARMRIPLYHMGVLRHFHQSSTGARGITLFLHQFPMTCWCVKAPINIQRVQPIRDDKNYYFIRDKPWKSWALNTASILKNITIIYNQKSHQKLFCPPPFLSLYHGYQLLFW